MYRKRLVSKPLDKLKFRIEAAKSFDDDFDFGNGINATELDEFSSDLEEAINGYNQTLSDADELRDTIRSLERQANDISERLLSLVGGTYGRDSLEYQRMGGTRKSEIQYTGTRPETYNSNGSAGDTSSDTGTGST
jgi:polyhydroxyalkanoate synthesis regulator phasin